MSKITRAGCLLAMLLAAFTWNTSVRAEDPTPEKIKALIKELGDEDFGKRTQAEKDLLKAGLKAMDALKAAQESADPQIKSTAAKLMGRIRLANLPPIDYFDVAPANSMIAMQLKNFGTSIENAKKSTFGQLILSPAMEPFRAKLDAALSAQPEVKKKILLWLSRFKGQVGVAVWELKLMPPEEIKLGAILEITDPEPQAVFEDFAKETHAFEGGMKTTLYKDVEIQQNPLGMGPALALLGKHMIIAPNIESVQKLVDGFVAPGGIAGTDAFKKAKPNLGAKPEMLIAMDFKAYMKAATAMNPMPGYEEMMKAAGVNVKYFFMSSASVGDSFEDRYVAINEGPPSGLAAAAIPPPGAPEPLNDMAIVPANAVAAAVGYLDGVQLKTALGEYLAGLKKMMDNMRAQMPGPVPIPDFDAAIKTFEAKTSLKVTDLAANVKGSIGYYVVLAPAGGLAPPDIGMFITCADAAKAKAFSDAISKGFEAYDKIGAIKTVDAPNRKIYLLDIAALGVPVEPKFPYTLCWSIEGNRIFVASSIEALRKQLSYIENKMPGLLAQPEFMKAMGALTAEERKGQLFYVDMKNLLTLGATIGLPLLQAQIPDAEIKKQLAALPQPSQLFKDIPPLLATSVARGDLAVGVMRSPVPPIQTIFVLSVGAGMAMPMMMGRPARPVDAPPGGF